MAFDKKPSTWFGPGYSYASNAITLTTAAGTNPVLTELTAAEANATTGDIREVMFAFCDASYNAWLAQGEIPADLPSKMSVSLSSGVASDGVTITRNFNFVFTNDIVSENVSPEPA